MSVTNKVVMVIDDQWLQEIVTKMIPFVEADEIFQILSVDDVDVCEDCQTYMTKDGEVVLDVFKCPDQQEFCLNCCGCEEHAGEAWY